MNLMEARAARFDEEDELKKLRSQKVQERNAKINALTNNTNNNNNANYSSKEPACWGMCPEFEMIDRQVTNDVSLFEAQIPFNPPQGKLIIDPKRAVKKFRRSAAGNYELAEDLRPPEVLLATTVYLMRDVLGDQRWPNNGVPFAVLYAFIRDRLRAIRTDLTLQNCKNLSSIRIHELSIRFLIASSHLLCEEERAAFEPQQNNEQLNGCLSALREMYKTVHHLNSKSDQSSSLLKYEAEFQAYSIILSVDKKEALLAISSLPLHLLQDPIIKIALEAYSAFQQTNYIKFLNLIRFDGRTTYLQACLLHQFVLPVRQRALSLLVSENSSSFRVVPKSDMIKWLAFVDEAELAYYSDRFGFHVIQDQIDLSPLIQRREAVDLKAEEENFKVRQFHHAIELKLRKNASLSELMFQNIDLDLPQVMSVLSKKPENVLSNSYHPLTSEFLAAAATSTSSPLQPKGTKKLFMKPEISSLRNEPINRNVIISELHNNSINNSINEVSNSSPTPKIDHQEILKKKLQVQAQERALRKERIDSISVAMLDALIDSITGFHVAESCTLAWDSIRTNLHQIRKHRIEALSSVIFDNLIETEIIPSVLDVELIKLRCRAAQSFDYKTDSVNRATFSILNSLKQEIFEEAIFESFLQFKSLQFVKTRWFRKLKNRRKQLNWTWQNIFDLKQQPLQQPIHVLFLGESFTSLLEPLIKAEPPNFLAHLQSFMINSNLKIIWSTNDENPFIISHLINFSHEMSFNCWPSNVPGPTLVIMSDDPFAFNLHLPWTPKILKIEDTCSFKEILSRVLMEPGPDDLPIINENIQPSDFIPEELLESFVIEPYERELSKNNQSEELLIELIRGFLDKLVWILFRSPQSTKLLSCHPKIAGKSRTLESLRKCQSLTETFVNLFCASKSFQMTLNSLDQVYGHSFIIGSLDCLYTTQSISDFIRIQNDIINRYSKRTRVDYTRDTVLESSKPTELKTIQVLKEKLRSEATESDAYERYLKKFL